MSTTTTTTTTTRAKDLRRPILSPVTAAILLALEAGPSTTRRLAEEVERLTKRRIKPKDILVYLYYYQHKGWVTNSSPMWTLTSEGQKLLLKYKSYLEQLVNANCILKKTKEDEIFSMQLLKKSREDNASCILKKTKEKINEKIEEIVENVKPLLRDKDEEDILRILLNRYFTTGSTYMYLEELVENLQADSVWLLTLLRSMCSRRLIYVWRRDNRVGLGKLVRELLGLKR